MSSGSSEVDVIRTRIPAYDDDNTVLYAYEPHTAYINKPEHVQSGTSCNEEQQKTMLDILNQCQAINDAIQNLDKKCDVIHGKVSKIYRCRAKSLWQTRKPHGHAHKNNYQHSRKQKFQKIRKREQLHSSFSYPESYSPTIPVGRRDIDSQSNPPETPFNSDESPEPEHDSLLEEQERDAALAHSPSLSSSSYQPSYVPDDAQMPSADGPCFSSPRAGSTGGLYSPTRACSTMSPGILAQGEPSPVHNPEMMNYSDLMENRHAVSSLCVPCGLVTSSPVERDPGILKQGFSEDPSTWSVEEVILFLKQTDAQTLGPIADLFRHHDIDGKALLLLKSDMMLKYMGLKLGTAVKLCHYIERLKEEKYYKEQRYYEN
nr:sex comb on midleg-like protein 1 isoform X1 [Microcebus murinus]XP_012640164.1 sex comb on midleg-like protein 1 isoform X1 [Microcebus murinus]XP_020140620.1 sex comb on midleg-like protein 1 isoform X1 [Microcebus murinus]